jgi:hypothetical protein
MTEANILARHEFGPMVGDVHNAHRLLRSLRHTEQDVNADTVAEHLGAACDALAEALAEMYVACGIGDLMPDPRSVKPGYVGYTLRQIAEMEARRG